MISTNSAMQGGTKFLIVNENDKEVLKGVFVGYKATRERRGKSGVSLYLAFVVTV